MKNISIEKRKGTIAWYFTKNQDSIYAPLYKNDIKSAKKVVLELLESPEITDEPAREKAKSIFSGKISTSNFLSTLVTYMTGMKV